MLQSNLARLISRAIVVGLTAGLSTYAASDGSNGAIVGALTAGVLAAAELVTPLNPVVGAFKNASVVWGSKRK